MINIIIVLTSLSDKRPIPTSLRKFYILISCEQLKCHSQIKYDFFFFPPQRIDLVNFLDFTKDDETNKLILILMLSSD
uniref:Uncharacterized protein n=1 Tax=Timema cristinae TaxID=61476 RepID=A0A7R9CEI0_TIMCR|nr:unnamed protein product [Timema cristinae]